MTENSIHLKIFRLWILCLCLLTVSALGVAQVSQTATVHGRILDDSTHLPIASANVFIANSMLGSSSDSTGYFQIRNIPPGFHELVASCVGYHLTVVRFQFVVASDTSVDFRLAPNIVKMGVVEVTAPDPAEWQNNLETFKKSLLGSTPESEACTLVNPEVLNFSVDAAGRFVAESDSTLIIDNRALGYRLSLSLGAFKLVSGALSTAWKVRYIAMRPVDSDQQSTWERHRQDVYSGSLRHFLVALAGKRVEDEGFIMFKSPSRRVLPMDKVLELNESDVARQSGPDEWTIRFDEFLVVTYDRTQVEVGGIGRRGFVSTRPKTSFLSLDRDQVRIDARGQILDQFALRISGDWAKEGLARELPLEFRPKSK
jgi:hypothetical protein